MSETELPIQITMFGPLHVTVNGQGISRPSKKALCILALLGLRAGRPILRSWLAETFWPEGDLKHGLDKLRHTLSELRKSLGSERNVIQSVGNDSISLHLERAFIDVLEFDRLLKGTAKLELLRAIELYSAPLLEDWTEEWVIPERQARQEACLNALHHLAELSVESGDPKSGVGFCRDALKVDPMSSESLLRLMQCLEGSGDRNAAVQSYKEYADRLDRELGLAPDEATSKLYRQIQRSLRNREGSTSAKSPEETSGASGNIPPQPSDLVGRDDECEEVASLLRHSRLVTLAGFGGIGKTRLALEVATRVAKEYGDGAWFVALGAITDGRLLNEHIARTLGLKEGGGDGLALLLKGKRLLLVLDNCEQILMDIDRIAAAILKLCPGVRILATSRAPFGITGEVVFAVPSLSVPSLNFERETHPENVESFEAVRLYVLRAQAHREDFKLDRSNAQPIATLCSRLEGIPLAIELAAARVETVSAEDLTTSLTPLFERDSSTDHLRTLKETLDWSYNLLEETEQALFRRLSVFVGGWSLTAAEKVCSDSSGEDQNLILGEEIILLLSSLVDKSLVVYEDGEFGGRYSFLEMVRHYAAQELMQIGERSAFELKHRDWVIEMVEQSGPHIKGSEQSQWIKRYEDDHDNFRIAIDRCEANSDSESTLRICSELARYWLMRNSAGEGYRRVIRSLEMDCSGANPKWRAKALNAATALAGRQGDYAAGMVYGKECIQIQRELGDIQGIGAVGLHIANLAYTTGDYQAARDLYLECVAMLEKTEYVNLLAVHLGSLGMVASIEGDFNDARSYFKRAVTIFQRMGDINGIGWALWNLGHIDADQGDLDTALDLMEKSMELCQGQSDVHGIARALTGQSEVALRRGDNELARRLGEQSLAMAREVEDRHAAADQLTKLGQIADFDGRSADAETLFLQSLEIWKEIIERAGEMVCLAAMAGFAMRQGDMKRAKSLALESLSLCRQTPRKMIIVSNLEVLGATSLHGEDPEAATQLWAIADELRQEMAAPVPIFEKVDHETRLAKARKSLGEVAFANAWSQRQSRSWRDIGVA